MGLYPDDLVLLVAVATSLACIVFTSASAAYAQIKGERVLWPVVRQLLPFLLLGCQSDPIEIGVHSADNDAADQVFLLLAVVGVGACEIVADADHAIMLMLALMLMSSLRLTMLSVDVDVDVGADIDIGAGAHVGVDVDTENHRFTTARTHEATSWY